MHPATEALEEKIELFRKFYGYQHIPHYDGSPHQHDQVDDAELVLHEVAHQALCPDDYHFESGHMRDATEIVGYYIEQLSNWQQDLNEIRALAIEFIVNRRMGLGLDRIRIIENAAKNTSCYRADKDLARFDRAIRMAERTFKVQFHADTIIEWLEVLRKS